MKKVIIIAQYEAMPGENDNSRFKYIANLLLKKGYSVEIITTNFYHKNKAHRIFDPNSVKDLKYKFTMIEEPGYPANVCLKRIYSHYVFSKNLEKYLNSIKEKIDVVYCSIPSLDTGKVAAKFCKKNNIKYVIDVQDLWPEAFKMVYNPPIISKLLYLPFELKANSVYKSADDIVAVSETYVKRAADVNKKYKNKLSVFLGTDLSHFDNCNKENKVAKNSKKIEIAYIGMLGHSYDLTNVINAIAELNKQGISNIKFTVMGKGPLREKFENYAKEKGIDYEFTGTLEYPKMVGRLCACDIAVNPIVKGAAQSIINKVADYAASGLPVLNTMECQEYRDLVENYNIGFNCINDDYIDLAEKMKILIKDKKLREKMGKNNRLLAEEKFDRRKTYPKIVELISKNV